jgi:hypothetical protein
MRILFVLLLGFNLFFAVILNREPWRSHELAQAPTPAKASELVATWVRESRIQEKRLDVYADFVFIPCYVAALIIACTWAGRKLTRDGHPVAARASLFMVGITLATAVIDVTENVALLKMLGAATDDLWFRITHVFSRLKFTIAAAPIFYIVYATFSTPRETPLPLE